MKRFVPLLLCATLGTSSVWGDVISIRSNEKPPWERVADQLIAVGCDAANVGPVLSRMTLSEQRYFSRSGTLALAGQETGLDVTTGQASILWYELVGGIFFIIFGIALIWIPGKSND